MKVKWYGVVGKQWVDELFVFTYGDADLRWVNFYDLSEHHYTDWWLPPSEGSQIIGDE